MITGEVYIQIFLFSNLLNKLRGSLRSGYNGHDKPDMISMFGKCIFYAIAINQQDFPRF